MKIALIQPQFAPNLFDLVAILHADRVVLLDDDLWSRKGRTHRAMIRDSEWINIPIKTEDKKKPIREVQIDHSEDWFTPFWNGIYHNFHSATYFDYFEDEVIALFDQQRHSKLLIDFNLTVFNKLLRFLELDIDYELASSSTYSIDDTRTILQEYQSKNYIHRIEGASFIQIEQQEIAEFAELSILHLLFHNGPETFKMIDLLK